jgi:hypothetical protein
MDANGVVLGDSVKQWTGHMARETALAPAISLAANTSQNARQRQSQSTDGAMLFGPIQSQWDRVGRDGR